MLGYKKKKVKQKILFSFTKDVLQRNYYNMSF